MLLADGWTWVSKFYFETRLKVRFMMTCRSENIQEILMIQTKIFFFLFTLKKIKMRIYRVINCLFVYFSLFFPSVLVSGVDVLTSFNSLCSWQYWRGDRPVQDITVTHGRIILVQRAHVHCHHCLFVRVWNVLYQERKQGARTNILHKL